MLSHQSHLHQLIAKKHPTQQEQEQIIKLIKKGCYDYPAVAFETAFSLLKNHSGSSKRFVCTDQLILSGLELKVPTEKLKGWITKFRNAIGEMPYVKKLSGFIDYILAENLDTNTLVPLVKQDHGDYDTKKRGINSYKLEGSYDEYVKELNKYLEDNSADVEAWIQLGQIYADKCHYLRSLFCYEEVIMLKPDNDFYYVRLAELYYTHGGKSNVASAIKYYSYVISRNPENMRALWGLYRSLNLSKQLQEHEKELLTKVSQAIRKNYQKKAKSIKLTHAL